MIQSYSFDIFTSFYLISGWDTADIYLVIHNYTSLRSSFHTTIAFSSISREYLPTYLSSRSFFTAAAMNRQNRKTGAALKRKKKNVPAAKEPSSMVCRFYSQKIRLFGNRVNILSTCFEYILLSDYWATNEIFIFKG